MALNVPCMTSRAGSCNSKQLVDDRQIAEFAERTGKGIAVHFDRNVPYTCHGRFCPLSLRGRCFRGVFRGTVSGINGADSPGEPHLQQTQSHKQVKNADSDQFSSGLFRQHQGSMFRVEMSAFANCRLTNRRCGNGATRRRFNQTGHGSWC